MDREALIMIEVYKKRYEEIMEAYRKGDISGHRKGIMLASLLTSIEVENGSLSEMVNRDDELGKLYDEISKARF